MHFLLFLLLVAVTLPLTALAAQTEDTNLSVPKLIRKFGYKYERHKVTTSDGYVLVLHRIPRGRTDRKVKPRVVLLVHGLFCSSTDFIIQGPEVALVYLLADEGFDVWMLNCRGNKYSRHHKSLDSTSSAFWNFSWHEIGSFDLPSTIDFVLDKTGEHKLFYIGYSQGATAFYVLCSLKPQYNNKIIAQFSVGPPVYIEHTASPMLRFMAFWEKLTTLLFNKIGHQEYLPSKKFKSKMIKLLCSDLTVPHKLCDNTLYSLAGSKVNVINMTLFNIGSSGHYPDSASTKQPLHYAQLVWSGRFRRFDYGKKRNSWAYGLSYPPDYSLEKVTAPVYLIVCQNDWLAAKVDVNRLCKDLGNCLKKIVVTEPTFSHLDFLFGLNVRPLVYGRVN